MKKSRQFKAQKKTQTLNAARVKTSTWAKGKAVGGINRRKHAENVRAPAFFKSHEAHDMVMAG